MKSNELYRNNIIDVCHHARTRPESPPLCCSSYCPSSFTQEEFETLAKTFRETYFDCFVVLGDCEKFHWYTLTQNNECIKTHLHNIETILINFTSEMYNNHNPFLPCFSIISEYLYE